MHVRTRRFTRSLVVSLAAGALVAGCGDDDDEAADDAAATPTAFAVNATAQGKKKALEFPSSIKAGLVAMTLTNSDTVPRSAQIIRVEGDQTVDDVLKVVNAEETKIPEFMQDGGGLGAVKPKASATATQNLAPGKYVIWDDEGGDEEDAPGNDELGAKGEFTVTGEATDDELPAAPATVTAIDEGTDSTNSADKKYDFTFKGLKAGTNQVRFENTGDQLHHALFFPIIGSKTLKEVEQAFGPDAPQGPPPVDFEKGVGTTVIDGDVAQNVSLDLEAGRYAVLCFLSDRKGGKSHAEQGMLKELTVE